MPQVRRWQQATRAVLRRDGHTCTCGLPATTARDRDGGPRHNVEARLVASCKVCADPKADR